ncbi:COX15/CtaA family protein [Pseudalkalibacillus salsuginis]|uniref:COX15/CtaA family protein n=1 Tax=Pseudalkalibacillus salsuginis TaxID=2910972 RepID=UPI001F1CEAF3|nr:heme A synthase [Pseudalkalibacillus salsuginis]MCF6410426.1 heme A synthase [Pseudalkalibacillus salsuginis]
MNRFLKLYAILTSSGMLLVLLMGAIVTTTGSGEGCGNSWPLCYGEVLPSQPKVETMIEYSHRLVSATLGLMVVILALWAWIKFREGREVKWLAFLSVFFIVFQGLLGAAAVVWGQSSFVLALHFGFSLISFASVVLLTMVIYESENERIVLKVNKRLKWNIYLLFIYLYTLVYTGALVRHTKASLACSGWPLCNGEIIPPTNELELIQYTHRFMAGLFFIWILLSYIQIKSYYKDVKVVHNSFVLLLILVSLQVTTGALIIFTNLNLFIGLMHGLFVSLLFATLSYLVMVALRKT